MAAIIEFRKFLIEKLESNEDEIEKEEKYYILSFIQSLKESENRSLNLREVHKILAIHNRFKFLWDHCNEIVISDEIVEKFSELFYNYIEEIVPGKFGQDNFTIKLLYKNKL
jgi:hypothetical protein